MTVTIAEKSPKCPADVLVLIRLHPNGRPHEVAVTQASGADAANNALTMIEETFALAQLARDMGVADVLQASALEVAA